MSLRHAVLIALQNEEGTGYEIAKWFDQGMGNFWSATHQQIYLELRKMVNAGFVTFTEIEQTGKPAKKVYAVTEQGMEELKSWLEKPVKQCAVKDALLMKIYSGHLLEPQKLLNIMQEQKEKTQALLDKFKDIEKQFFSDLENCCLQQRYVYLTLRSGMIHAKASLAWCDEVIRFLDAKIADSTS